MGNPKIDVVRHGTLDSVKQVDKTDGPEAGTFWLYIDENTPLEIGVSLPGDVEGKVDVSVVLVGDGCGWSGNSDMPVDVKSGGTATSSVMMSRRSSCEGTNNTDGSADTSDSGDGPPTIVVMSDGGQDGDAIVDGAEEKPDAAALYAKCTDYCARYLRACGDVAPTNPSGCRDTCVAAAWLDGTHAQPQATNTFACREDHLTVVTNDGALSCSECYAASPESLGVCGPAPDGGNRDACPFD